MKNLFYFFIILLSAGILIQCQKENQAISTSTNSNADKLVVEISKSYQNSFDKIISEYPSGDLDVFENKVQKMFQSYVNDLYFQDEPLLNNISQKVVDNLQEYENYMSISFNEKIYNDENVFELFLHDIEKFNTTFFNKLSQNESLSAFEKEQTKVLIGINNNIYNIHFSNRSIFNNYSSSDIIAESRGCWVWKRVKKTFTCSLISAACASQISSGNVVGAIVTCGAAYKCWKKPCRKW